MYQVFMGFKKVFSQIYSIICNELSYHFIIERDSFFSGISTNLIPFYYRKRFFHQWHFNKSHTILLQKEILSLVAYQQISYNFIRERDSFFSSISTNLIPFYYRKRLFLQWHIKKSHTILLLKETLSLVAYQQISYHFIIERDSFFSGMTTNIIPFYYGKRFFLQWHINKSHTILLQKEILPLVAYQQISYHFIIERDSFFSSGISTNLIPFYYRKRFFLQWHINKYHTILSQKEILSLVAYQQISYHFIIERGSFFSGISTNIIPFYYRERFFLQWHINKYHAILLQKEILPLVAYQQISYHFIIERDSFFSGISTNLIPFYYRKRFFLQWHINKSHTILLQKKILSLVAYQQISYHFIIERDTFFSGISTNLIPFYQRKRFFLQQHINKSHTILLQKEIISLVAYQKISCHFIIERDSFFSGISTNLIPFYYRKRFFLQWHINKYHTILLWKEILSLVAYQQISYHFIIERDSSFSGISTNLIPFYNRKRLFIQWHINKSHTILLQKEILPLVAYQQIYYRKRFFLQWHINKSHTILLQKEILSLVAYQQISYHFIIERDSFFSGISTNLIPFYYRKRFFLQWHINKYHTILLQREILPLVAYQQISCHFIIERDSFFSGISTNLIPFYYRKRFFLQWHINKSHTILLQKKILSLVAYQQISYHFIIERDTFFSGISTNLIPFYYRKRFFLQWHINKYHTILLWKEILSLVAYQQISYHFIIERDSSFSGISTNLIPFYNRKRFFIQWHINKSHTILLQKEILHLVAYQQIYYRKRFFLQWHIKNLIPFYY